VSCQSPMFWLGCLTMRTAGFYGSASTMSVLECGQLQALGSSRFGKIVVVFRGSELYYHTLVLSLFRIIILC